MTSSKTEITTELEAQDVLANMVSEVEKAKQPLQEGNTNEAAKDETETAPERELTEFEQAQVKEGWNPSGERTAEEWALTKPLYDEIKKRGKELKKLTQTQENMKAVMQKLEKQAYEKAYRELSAHRDQAIEQNDAVAVANIDRQIEEIKPSAEPCDEIKDFMERNSEWFNGVTPQHLKMTKFIVALDGELMKKKLDIDNSSYVQLLEEHLHAEFPNYFEPKEDKSSKQAVESGNSTVFAKKRTKSYTISDLNSDQKHILFGFERSRVIAPDSALTREKFIQLLAESGELG